jgi:invasion protein IalB
MRKVVFFLFFIGLFCSKVNAQNNTALPSIVPNPLSDLDLPASPGKPDIREDVREALKPARDRLIKDWRLICFEFEENNVCSVVQNLITEIGDKKESVMTVSISYAEDVSKYRMNLTVPLGVYIPLGINFKVNDTIIDSIPYVRCLNNGCSTEFELEQAFIDILKSNKEALITFYISNEDKVEVPFSLNGIDIALEATKEEQNSTKKEKDKEKEKEKEKK